MRRPLRFGRFDLQVRAVLFLLVLLLALLDIVNLFLLRQGRQALARAERQRAEALVERAFDHFGADALRAIVTHAPSGAGLIDLREPAYASGLDRIVLRDATGTIVAGAGGAGESGDRLRAALPIIDGAGRRIGTLEGEVESPEYRAFGRSFRYVLAGQAAGVLLILLLALGVAEWVSRPYRRLAAAAEEAGWTSSSSATVAEPEALVAAVRGMVGKLKEQDDALASLARREGGGLAVAARFVSSAAERMSTGALAVDSSGRLAALNPAARSLLGCGGRDVVGRALDELPRRVTGLAEAVGRCLETGTGRSREVLEWTSQGVRLGHLGVAITPALDAGGSVEGVLVLLSDLTEIRWLQERARLRDGLAAVGEISAGIVHEVRNALGTILGHARSLEKRAGDGLQVPVQEILREVSTIRSVLDQFLAYAKPPAATRELLDLAQAARRAAASAPVGIRVVVAGEFGAVFGDEVLLGRALDNLMQNAADSAAESQRELEVRLIGRLLRDRGLCEILVEDDGPGVPPEARDHLFVPFFTTRSKGTGLGLALVQRTIVDMGGSIEAGEGPRGGAQFRLQLPLADPTQSSMTDPSQSGEFELAAPDGLAPTLVPRAPREERVSRHD